jgi:hypothetical protein
MLVVTKRLYGKANPIKKSGPEAMACRSQKQILHSSKKKSTAKGPQKEGADFAFHAPRDVILLERDPHVKDRFTLVKKPDFSNDDAQKIEKIWTAYLGQKKLESSIKAAEYLKSRSNSIGLLKAISEKLFILATARDSSVPPTNLRPPSLGRPIRLPFTS